MWGEQTNNMNKIINTLSVGVTTESNKNNNNRTVGGSKMTRKQRRKMEREMKKQRSHNQQKSVEIYGFTLCDLRTMEKYDVAPIGINTGVELDGSNSVYMTELFVHLENDTEESICLLNVVHNREEGMYDEEMMEFFLFFTLKKVMDDQESPILEILNRETRLTMLVGLGFELESLEMENLYELLARQVLVNKEVLTSVENEVLTLLGEYGKTG
jgi:hypothetical protein